MKKMSLVEEVLDIGDKIVDLLTQKPLSLAEQETLLVGILAAQIASSQPDEDELADIMDRIQDNIYALVVELL